uniref:Aspartic peptidase DDI1-type domain-containing protein n=1 Tax=Fagus sylvatica TaxID=28930 RepID=A0A2N9EH73_FAGSY
MGKIQETLFTWHGKDSRILTTSAQHMDMTLGEKPKDAMDYLDEIAENSNTWNGPNPLDSTDLRIPQTGVEVVLPYLVVIKDLCTVKRKHHVKKTAFLTEQVNAIIQHKVPPKYKDPCCPTISCTIGDYNNSEHALLDLGASVNLLPFSVYLQLGRPFLATANALINCRNGRMKIIFGSMTTELNIFNVNPQQLVDEECEYVNFIEAAPQEEFNNHCYPHPFETLLMLEKEQVVVAEKPPRSKKKSLLAYSDAPKLGLMKTPKEIEKEGEKTKFFERHETKRRALHDTRLSKKLLNSSKGVALHVARMKSARGSNYSFGVSRSGG